MKLLILSLLIVLVFGIRDDPKIWQRFQNKNVQ